MELIARAKRARYVWSWRARYWWLDTQDGVTAHWLGVCIAILVFLLQAIRIAVAAIAPLPHEPAKAVYWWVVQIIIAVVAAAVAYSMRPKVQTPAPQSGDVPTVEDGQTAKHHFGTCWVEDEFLLAWKPMGTIPIKTKGGKK